MDNADCRHFSGFTIPFQMALKRFYGTLARASYPTKLHPVVILAWAKICFFDFCMKLKNKLKVFLVKVFHFEYWPFWIFYIPMYFYGLYLAFRARSFMYFSATNPGMKYGGVMGESKFGILKAMPGKYLPKTVFIAGGSPYCSIIHSLTSAGLIYPLVMKPDVGERGKDVEIIRDEPSLKSYLADKAFDLIAQEYINYDLEFGMLYHRMPGSSKGEVTSVVQKGFLTVTGDGTSALRELISGSVRASGRQEYLYNKFADQLEKVLPLGHRMRLEPIGNHCRGTIFYNANHLINPLLHDVFNRISLDIEGFFMGASISRCLLSTICTTAATLK